MIDALASAKDLADGGLDAAPASPLSGARRSRGDQAPVLARAAAAIGLVAGMVVVARFVAPYPGSRAFEAWWRESAWLAPRAPLLVPLVLIALASAIFVIPILARNRPIDLPALARFAAWLAIAAPAGSAMGAPSIATSNGIMIYALWLALIAAAYAIAPRASWVPPLLGIGALLLAASVVADAEGLLGAYRRAPGGFLRNRNFAGEYLALTVVPCAAWMAQLAGARRWARAGAGALMGLALALVGLALALTRCRTGWLTAAVALALWIALEPRSRRRAAVAMTLFFVAGFFLATLLPTRLHWTEQRPYAATLFHLVDVESGSGALRIQQYRSTVGAIVGEHRLLLGVAPGQWHAMMTAVDRSVSVNWIPHSDYLRELSDAGLVGLSGLLFLHAAMTMAAWRLRRAHPTLLPVAVAIALVGLADISLCRPETAAIDALLLAVTLFGPRSDDGPTTAKSPSIDPRMNPSGSSPTASTRP